MAGFEVLAEVAAFNAAMVQAELDEEAARLADSLPDMHGMKGPRAPREDVPAELWRACRQ